MARELENALTLPDTPVQIKTEASAPAALHGSVMVLIQFDVCEEIRLDRLREIGGSPTAAELVCAEGARIAQIVRGETAQLSDGERNEILQSRISYYPNDLAVIGWNAAFLYDSEIGAETAIQLLEYANSQLLEFRHYDELLTRELEGVYASLDKGTGMLARWRMARDARKLHTVFLDVTG